MTRRIEMKVDLGHSVHGVGAVFLAGSGVFSYFRLHVIDVYNVSLIYCWAILIVFIFFELDED